MTQYVYRFGGGVRDGDDATLGNKDGVGHGGGPGMVRLTMSSGWFGCTTVHHRYPSPKVMSSLASKPSTSV